MTEPEAPSTARMIDYWLGGSDHFPVDVAAARAFESAYGPCADIFRSLRAFSGRAVRHLAAGGIDRFLVFGAGIPTRGNVHEQAPGARVLYTDIDPQIVAAGAGIVAGTAGVGYVRGDATDLAAIDGVPGSTTMTMQIVNTAYFKDWTLKISGGQVVGDSKLGKAADGPDAHFEVTKDGDRFKGTGYRSYNGSYQGKPQRCKVSYDALLKRLDI